MLLNRRDVSSAGHAAGETRSVPERVVSVLAVSPLEEDHVFLGALFTHSNWQLRSVRNWADALDALDRQPSAVVICEKELPDCEWKEALLDLAQFPTSPLLIVTSRYADDQLWAEVLNLGGYDVLMKPFDRTEVIRVISLAWLNWKNLRERNRQTVDQGMAAMAG